MKKRMIGCEVDVKPPHNGGGFTFLEKVHARGPRLIVGGFLQVF